MTRVAVIADTHDILPVGFPGRLAKADEIWHLGDVCDPEIIGQLESLGKPVHVVLGNNDSERWPVELILQRFEHRFLLVHISPARRPPGVRFVLHGHTHVPRDETDAAGVRWLNPGCLARANRGAPASFAWLTIVAKAPPTWQLELV